MALAAMHDADRERGIDPLAVERPVEPPAQTVVGGGLRIEPPDWPAEERERQERERQQRIAEAAALLEPAEQPAKPTPPAAKGEAA
jgi:hypothetical protein